jgi:flagellin-specific chaperone FliS
MARSNRKSGQMTIQMIYSNASQASRYATNATQRVSVELFVKAQELNRLMAEIAELANEIDANGNAPSREAAQNILREVKS